MKLFEKIIVAFTVIAVLIYLFTVSHLGANLVLFSLFTMAIFYMVYGLANFKNISLREFFNIIGPKPSGKNSILSKMAGIAIAIVIVGFLFKILQWEGGSFQLLVGLIILSLLICILLLLFLRTKSIHYFEVLKRGAIFFVIGILIYLIPSDSIIEFKYRNHPEYLEALKYFQTDSSNDELKVRLMEEQEKL